MSISKQLARAPLVQMVFGVGLAACLFVPAGSFGAFGLTSSARAYIVDSGAGLVFKVARSTGDVTSLVFNGVEYQAAGKNSQIASGLGAATTVTGTIISNQYILITCTTAATNPVVKSLTHYLMARSGYNNLYMATYVTSEPRVGELRWITRLKFDRVPNGPAPSDNNGSIGPIESADIFGHTNDAGPGTLLTTSKYYGRQRALDLTCSGARGDHIGVWSVFDNPRESSSGGPFYRDIENQGDGSGRDQEIYNYMNSGHEKTEAWRSNVLYGPYCLAFTTGAPPALPMDYSWIETAGLNLTGWVSATNRGAVAGVATGIPTGFQGVVGFASPVAQYWAVVASNGTYRTPLMKPGVYAATLYKGELPVANTTASVNAGATTTLNLASTEPNPRYVFKIGEWDGTPAGLLNGGNIINMHPRDVRNAGWGPITYDVSTNVPADFPSIQMRLVNSPTTILFNLSTNQLIDYTLRVGMTCACNGGRPQVTINRHALRVPGASSQPNSRSFTTGTYRGNEVIESYGIPAGDLVPGRNILTITPFSGSADLGTWLSAGWVYDAVELDLPAAAPAARSRAGESLRDGRLQFGN